MLAVLLSTQLNALLPALWPASGSPRARPPRMQTTDKLIELNGASYEVTVAGRGYAYPPVLLIPPVGVGIDRKFYSKLQAEWARLGLPVELHAIDLLGCGSSAPLPRCFYTPEIWAEQVLSYVSEHIGRPVIVLVQGGMVPVALELWRRGGGRPTVAGVVFASPPPFQFFAPEAVAAANATADSGGTKAPGRFRQRLFWLISQSSVGGFFYRYLRGCAAGTALEPSARGLGASPAAHTCGRRIGASKRGARIKAFSEASLFAAPLVERCRPPRARTAPRLPPWTARKAPGSAMRPAPPPPQQRGGMRWPQDLDKGELSPPSPRPTRRA